MLNLIEIALNKNDIPFVRLDGGMTSKDREKSLTIFKNDPNMTVCIFSLKAGGLGLNLVHANTVFLMDVLFFYNL
jgi:SNF2 family DNA or RNA helicase